jgi:hypothetical protein
MGNTQRAFLDERVLCFQTLLNPPMSFNNFRYTMFNTQFSRFGTSKKIRNNAFEFFIKRVLSLLLEYCTLKIIIIEKIPLSLLSPLKRMEKPFAEQKTYV